MPTFPQPPSPVPNCLNPWNPIHVLLVAYWVYFCPTALKSYLYEANPVLYKAASGDGIFKTLASKAYRNLYFCLPPAIALISFGLSAITLLLLPASPLSWSHWGLGLLLGNLIGIIFLVVYSMTFSMTASTARGAASGSVVSMTAGVANAAVLAVVLARAPDWSFTQVLTVGNVGLAALFGFIVGTSVLLTIGGIAGGIIGIVTGLASGAVAGTVFGIIATAVGGTKASSLVFATIIGLATSGAFGASMTFASGLTMCLAMGVFVGISINLVLYQNAVPADTAILYGGLVTLTVWTGSLRLFPVHIGYLLYVTIGMIPGFPLKHHPIAWDELIVLPLPGTFRYLEASLLKKQTVGLARLIQAARNPFQRPVVQRVLKKYFSRVDNFLPVLYQLLNEPISQAYVFAPVDVSDWEHLPASKQLLLGELSSEWVNCTSEPTSYRVERFLYGITWLQRDHTRTLQSTFCHLLYDVSYGKERQQGTPFNLSSYAPVYTSFEHQPGGTEIKQSFDMMAEFLSYTDISHLPRVDKLITHLPLADSAIRPNVVDILGRLQQLAHDISISNQSNSLFIQQSSLLRANSTLEALHQSVNSEVVSPEFRLLKQIVKQWSQFVREAGGEVGRLTHKPTFIKNPYVIGTPVTGEALVGREDILRRITDELFATPGQCPSIVLYGHRRMGKSSILRSLSKYLSSSQIKAVDFNMQILGHISNTSELLYALSRQIYRTLAPEQMRRLTAPERSEFTDQNPYHALNDFFQKISPALSGHSFIIAIDEFEKIEEKIEKGQLSESILEFLRGLTQTYPWFSLVFAGLHTLEEMCYSYWHPFFTSIPIRVSFLSTDAAKQLVRQANNIAYEDEVVSKVVHLANGQPYLIQLIGHTLVTYFNRGLLSKRTADDFLVFNLDDLQKILDSPEFYSIGNAYFKGIWLQALTSSVEGQVEILKKLATQPMSAEQLVAVTGFPYAKVALALNTLREHDVIILEGSSFTYAVELMRRWVVSTQC